MEIYSEYNFPTDSLLDYRATWRLREHLKLRFGQWKSDYNRERIDSSGKQQFVDRSLSDNAQWEWSLGANWYFNGHRNKLSADFSTLHFDDPGGAESDHRFRLQWDVSF